MDYREVKIEKTSYCRGRNGAFVPRSAEVFYHPYGDGLTFGPSVEIAMRSRRSGKVPPISMELHKDDMTHLLEAVLGFYTPSERQELMDRVVVKKVVEEL